MSKTSFCLFFGVCLLSACSGAPKRNLNLERIELSLKQLEADSSLAPLATAEIARAREAIRALDKPNNNQDQLHLTYLAERRIDIAYATAQAVQEENRLIQLQRENDQILLEASRKDAELSRLEADKLRLQTLAKAEETERARAETAQALEQKDQSLIEATAAREIAEQAKRLAKAQALETKLAKQEAALAVATAESLSAQMQSLTAHQAQQGLVMVLSESAFESGQSVLRSEALANLQKVLDFVNSDVKRAIRIEGHTDNRGQPSMNQALSLQRAESVRDALINRGIDAKRIRVLGRGDTTPVASNDTLQGRARNRRVEIILEVIP